MRAVAVKLLLHLMAWLPLAWVQACAGGVARLALRWPHNPALRVSLVNLGLCLPELAAAERESLARASLIESTRSLFELGPLWRWPVSRVLGRVVQCEGLELLHARLAEGRGVVMLSPHLGAWEVTSLHIAAHAGCPLVCLYRPPRLAALEGMVRRARERSGVRLLPTDAQGVRGLYQALRQGHAIGILPDQNPTQGGGVFAPFFGVPAYTMWLVARLARKTGAAVLFCYAERLPHGQGFKMRYLDAPAGIADPDPAVAAAALNRGVEACIRACPSQYLWAYKRFKIRPPGAESVYP